MGEGKKEMEGGEREDRRGGDDGKEIEGGREDKEDKRGGGRDRI